MASVGHLAVGLAAARTASGWRARSTWSALALWCVVSLLPDLDFAGLAFGVSAESIWGHRGATHSVGFVALGVLAAVVIARRRGLRVGPIVAVTAAVLMSHPLLDATTTNGPGSALLWPFDATRYKLPWILIPTVPTAGALFALAALPTLAWEAMLFFPLVAYACWPARRRYDGRR